MPQELQSAYHLGPLLGKGGYGKVYKARRRNDPKRFWAVKKLDGDVSEKRIQMEIKILMRLQRVPEVVQLKEVCIDAENHDRPCLVFEYIPAPRWSKLWSKFSLHDVRDYAWQLVRAMAQVHRAGIVHNDIKPQNLLIDHPARELTIIDFGQADVYRPAHKKRIIGTRTYRAPELLLRYAYYDAVKCDVWGAGLSILYMALPNLKNALQSKDDSDRDDNLQQLDVWASVFGSAAIKRLAKKFGMSTPHVSGPHVTHGLKDFIKHHMKSQFHRFTPELRQLIDCMVAVDPDDRWTMQRLALMHPYFQSCRARDRELADSSLSDVSSEG